MWQTRRNQNGGIVATRTVRNLDLIVLIILGGLARWQVKFADRDVVLASGIAFDLKTSQLAAERAADDIVNLWIPLARKQRTEL